MRRLRPLRLSLLRCFRRGRRFQRRRPRRKAKRRFLPQLLWLRLRQWWAAVIYGCTVLSQLCRRRRRRLLRLHSLPLHKQFPPQQLHRARRAWLLRRLAQIPSPPIVRLRLKLGLKLRRYRSPRLGKLQKRPQSQRHRRRHSRNLLPELHSTPGSWTPSKARG